MWFKKLFGLKTVSTKQVKKEPIKNIDSIQFGLEKKPTKNKWLHPQDNFGKLKRGTNQRWKLLKQDTVMKKWNKILFCFLETENKYQVEIIKDNRNYRAH